MPDYHRNLPHWLPAGPAIFLTWRLHGSLLACVLQELREEKTLTAGQEFALADQHMDRAGAGPLWLKDTRIAECVSHYLELGDSKFHRYDLHSCVVMANHVHVLLTPKIELQWITRSLKGITASLSNQILQRTKQPFWQQESYDHWCRDDVEFQRIRGYIASNPVKAGLVSKPELWLCSSAHRLGRLR
jgi:REP-associated tyrosine transposase